VNITNSKQDTNIHASIIPFSLTHLVGVVDFVSLALALNFCEGDVKMQNKFASEAGQ
jgi:hypothetical protein